MGLLTRALKPLSPSNLAVNVSIAQSAVTGLTSPGGNFVNNARAYSNNEIVYAAIELLATSAAEPHITGRRYRRNSPQIRAERAMLNAKGLSPLQVNALLVLNGYFEEVPQHPLVQLLNNPNPFVTRFQLWSTVIMDRYLAGNAYLLKARYTSGLLQGAVAELWRLRPDRVRVVPGNMAHGEPFIKGYEYDVGGGKVFFEARDIIHFKTRHPLDAYYGMPPLMAIAGRIDIDNYMRNFLRTFFERGGTGPGSILSTKGEMDQEDKDAIRDRFRRQFGGQAGWHEMLILDNTEMTYTPLGLNRGLRDALPKEIDAANEARIAMAFGIPGSILGLLIGYESSSYANKRQDWQVLWDITLTPLYGDMDDVLNLSLTPEFGGIDEVCFDLSQIRALQEDVDKLHDRERKNLQAGGSSVEEFRDRTGYGELPQSGTLLIPSSAVQVKVGDLGNAPEVPSEPAQLMARAVALLAAPSGPGRPRLEQDDQARDIWSRAEQLRAQYPNMTWEQVASRLSVSERTLRRYRDRYEDDDDDDK